MKTFNTARLTHLQTGLHLRKITSFFILACAVTLTNTHSSHAEELLPYNTGGYLNGKVLKTINKFWGQDFIPCNLLYLLYIDDQLTNSDGEVRFVMLIDSDFILEGWAKIDRKGNLKVSGGQWSSWIRQYPNEGFDILLWSVETSYTI